MQTSPSPWAGRRQPPPFGQPAALLQGRSMLVTVEEKAEEEEKELSDTSHLDALMTRTLSGRLKSVGGGPSGEEQGVRSDPDHRDI